MLWSMAARVERIHVEVRLYSHSFFLATWHLPLLPFLASLAHPPSAPQNTHLPRWTPVSQLQTWQEHISLQAWQKNYLWCYNAVRTQRGRRNDPHNLSSAIFIWNIYPLEKVTGSKVASKLKSDEGYVGKNFFSAEFNCSDHREITIFSTDTIQNAHSLGKWDNTTADIILSWNIRTFITKSLMSSKQDSFFATTGCWRQEALTRPSTRHLLGMG